MASQTSSGDSSVQAAAYNPDPNTLIVTLEDGSGTTSTKVFEGKYDDEGSGTSTQGGAHGTLTYSRNFNPGDSASFDAGVDGTEVTITFTDTVPTFIGPAATAVFKGTGYIRPGTGKGVWLGVLANV